MSIKWRATLIFIVIIVGLGAGIFLLWIFLLKGHKETEGTIKIGILHSLTGAMAVSEKPVVDATLFAINEINENGGVLGKKVVPIIADGKSDWPTFAREAEKLVTEEHVMAIFGCWTSASRKMVKPVVEKYNNLLFYPVQFEGLETSSNIIYLGASANQQAIPAVTWSLQNFGKRLFLVGSDYIYPRAVNSIIKDVVAARNGTIVGEEYIPLQRANVDEVIKKIIKTNPDAIINTINGEENSGFFKALRKAGISSEKIPTMSLSVGETELSAFNIEEMIGDYGAQSYFETLNTAVNNNFVEKYKKKYGADKVISNSMENAYSGIYFWKNAVTKAQTAAPQAVREQLRGEALSAPEGIISIDRKTLYTWKAVLIGKIFPSKKFGLVWNSITSVEPLPYPPLQTKEHWQNLMNHFYTQYGNKWWK